MQALRAKVLTFSKDLQTFTQDLSNSVDELKRTARAKPCVGATAFRESYEELAQQTSRLATEVTELENLTLDTISLEELLGHCVAQLRDNDARMHSLEAHLREYGYKAEYKPPAKESELPKDTVEEEQSSAPTSKGGDVYQWEAPKRRRSYSLPGGLHGGPVGIGQQDSTPTQLPTVTPSPLSSGMLSANSVSPSLRELQLKYGRLSLSGSSPEDPGSADGRRQESRAAQDVLGRETGLRAQADLAEVPLTDSSSLTALPSFQEPGVGRSFDSGSPTAIPVRQTPARVLTVNTGRRTPVAGEAGSPSMPRSNQAMLGKGDIIATRLAAGEAPWDMLSLKAAINNATPGTGEVEKAIGGATFHPQAAAFTSLLHMCAKHKLWEKALEVFEGMKAFHPAVVPNTVHFSSLISACGTAGRWQEAMRVFEEMKEHSQKDPQCAPNVITYSALMTACCAGGRPDKAHEAFLDMKARGIQPDHISYSTLIAGYERWGDLEKAKALFEEMKEGGLLQTGMTAKVPAYLEQFNRKLQRSTSKASENDQETIGGGEPGHRVWNSFGSNTASVDSPFIGAHYGGHTLSRRPSSDLAAPERSADAMLRSELLHTRSPSHVSLTDHLGSATLAAQQTLMGQQTPVAAHSSLQPASPSAVQLLQASRHRGGLGRSMAPSPLSNSFDATHMPGQQSMAGILPSTPYGPSVNAFQTPGVVGSTQPRFAGDFNSRLGPSGMRPGQGIDAGAFSQHLTAPPGLDMDVASQLLGAFVQQQAIVHQALSSPVAPMPRESFAPPASAAKAANGAPQIAQISVQEYNALPIRFSRQLSWDQMNDAVDYINAIVEGKHGKSNPKDQADGLTPQELAPLELGNQRTTALLNCLLQLKRVRLTVRDGQQLCQLLT